jgi:hypothetical protein
MNVPRFLGVFALISAVSLTMGCSGGSSNIAARGAASSPSTESAAERLREQLASIA